MHINLINDRVDSADENQIQSSLKVMIPSKSFHLLKEEETDLYQDQLNRWKSVEVNEELEQRKERKKKMKKKKMKKMKMKKKMMKKMKMKKRNQSNSLFVVVVVSVVSVVVFGVSTVSM